MNKKLTSRKKKKPTHKQKITTNKKSQTTTKKRVMLEGRLSGKIYQRCSLITDLVTDPIYYFHW